MFHGFPEGILAMEEWQGPHNYLYLFLLARRGIDIGHSLLYMGEIKTPKTSFIWLANTH